MANDSIPAEYLGTLTGTIDKPHAMVAGAPTGTRGTATVLSASLIGPKIKATMPDGVAGADWYTVRADGSVALDVRLNLRTDDGADIFLHYTGYAADGALKTAPRFETGDERYTWLNTAFTVALGEPTDDGVTYELYLL